MAFKNLGFLLVDVRTVKIRIRTVFFPIKPSFPKKIIISGFSILDINFEAFSKKLQVDCSKNVPIGYVDY